MKKECREHCDICDVDFSEDNGYGYVIDELKAVRAHIDEVIRLMETRIEKDAILDKVLNTSYNDNKEKDCCYEIKKKEYVPDKDNEESIFDEFIKDIPIVRKYNSRLTDEEFDEIIKDTIAKNNIEKTKRALKLPYPLWSMYSKDMWF